MCIHREPAFLPILLFLTFVIPAVAIAGNADCLVCHADADAVGETFRIDHLTFDTTAHAALGCRECHTSVTTDHPGDGIAPSKADCRGCHEAISAEYARSTHQANADCRDCHNPHVARGPAAVSGADMNRQCESCHGRLDTTLRHAEWLPQTDLHMAMLPCISCHTASEENVITLYIIRRSDTLLGDGQRLATYPELKELAEGKSISSLIDRNEDDYISLTELRMFNSDPENRMLRLQGMITPEAVTHDFRTLDNRWDCSFCHASGPGARQTSYVSLAREDGSYLRIAAEKGAVLDALYGTPDFYMVGATRSKVLDVIGMVIIAGGMVMPVGHGTLRFLTRKNREHKEEE
ncbi:MAG: cytochrome C [Deltaproteobacteria bacterium]|nr:MAG: cytochrome C [Deltaproteobacteria bacterium]